MGGSVADGSVAGGSVAGGSVGGGSVGGGDMAVGGGDVSAGGGGVLVAGGRGVRLEGGRSLMVVATGRGRRVRVGWRGVDDGRKVAVAVSEGRGVREAVLVGTTVGVGTNAVTACSVNPAAVPRLSTANSTMFTGSRVVRLWLFKSFIASAETLHNKLTPNTPAARTPRGPV